MADYASKTAGKFETLLTHSVYSVLSPDLQLGASSCIMAVEGLTCGRCETDHRLLVDNDRPCRSSRGHRRPYQALVSRRTP